MKDGFKLKSQIKMASTTEKKILISSDGKDKSGYRSEITVKAGDIVDLSFELINISNACIKFIVPPVNDEKANTVIIEKADWSNILVDKGNAAKLKIDYGQITIKPPVGQSGNFYFSIRKFKVSAKAGVSEILVFDGKEEINYLTINKVKDDDPLILSFEADQYFVNANTPVTLNWRAKNITNFKLFYGQREISLDSPQANSYVLQNFSGSGDYVLQGFNGATAHPPASAKVDLKAFYRTEVSVVHRQFPDKSRILGLYPDAEKDELYALVQEDGASEATLYLATHNILESWEPVYINKSTSVEDESEIQPLTLPLDVALSPGVIFEGKLWFIGGSSYDPDLIANTHGYLNLKTREWVDKGTISRNGTNMLPRMGHVCIVHNGKIWVIGGHNPDNYYALRDIWTYGNGSWEKLAQELPSGKCMMAACNHVFETTNEQLWLFGGYEDMPAGKRSYKFYCMNDGENIEVLDVDVPVNFDTIKYHAVSLATDTHGKIYLFADKIYELNFENKWELSSRIDQTDWLYKQNGHQLQTVAFQQSVWINAVHFPQGNVFLDKRGHLFHCYFVK